jgi:hypothetical protein
MTGCCHTRRVEQHPLGRHQPVDPQRVVEAAVPPTGEPECLTDPEGHVVAEDRQAGAGRQVQQVGHARPHRRPPVGHRVSVEVLPRSSAGQPHVDAVVNRLARRQAGRADRAVLRAGDVGPGHPDALDLVAAHAQGSVDREDLGVGHMAHHAGLRDVLAGDRQGDVDVEDGRGSGVRQVLRRRPDDRALARVLHRRDGGAERAPAEQERGPGGDAGGDRQDPARRVVRRFESEPLAGIHRGDSRCQTPRP